ncbi:hypothetical protein IW140_004022 [Coemansia sp. RSA 1813]|nr:hypothetical protein EV178_003957 [Coemansia sp. RSA 1646]KAJ2217068.1 hypothetical protein EV179_000835 [Coemansia sp. RSA 487]KAJ2568294.1 hypothetical protein IW140_004022 [Coemansia sp. RSA 1813]
MKTIVDWATEYFCSKNDDKVVEGLVQLQQLYSEGMPCSEPNDATTSKDGQPSDNIPMYIALYRLRKLLKMLGPLYLGLTETEEALGAKQPWASPLKLQCVAKDVRATRRIDSGSSTLDDDRNESAPKRRKPDDIFCHSSLERHLSAKNKPLEHEQTFSNLNAAALDIPELVRMLVIIENTRRYYASELLSKRHAQGPLGDQSERWEHGFAKRNIAAETKFENLLVALKELVVLRAIADPEIAERGDIKQVLEHTGAQQQTQKQDLSNDSPVPEKSNAPNRSIYAVILSNRFDPARCLAILNLMFPLDPLHADRRLSFNTSRWQQQYAFPLQHVPSPRTQLYQLICEVEAWVNGEDCGVSASGQAQQSHDGQSKDDYVRSPMSCPAWLASARSFAWSQFKQSLQAYLQDTEHKIATQYRMIHPWSSPETSASGSTSAATPRNSSISFLEHMLNENKYLLKRIEEKAPVNATALEHIAHHARLADLRFTKRMLLDQLKL